MSQPRDTKTRRRAPARQVSFGRRKLLEALSRCGATLQGKWTAWTNPGSHTFLQIWTNRAGHKSQRHISGNLWPVLRVIMVAPNPLLRWSLITLCMTGTSAISLRIRPSSSHSPISQEQLEARGSIPMDELRNEEQPPTPENPGSASDSRPGTAGSERRDRRLRRRLHAFPVQGRSSHATPGRTSRTSGSRSSSQDSYTKSAAATNPPKRGATPPAPVSSQTRHGSRDVSPRSVPRTGEVRTSSSPARHPVTATTQALPARPKPAQKDAAPSADALKKQKKVAESTGQAGGLSKPKAPSSKDPRVKNVKH